MRYAILTLFSAALLSSGAIAKEATVAAPEASIGFANKGGISDWQEDGDSALYVRGTGKQWYHAKLFAPCRDLPFANAIGFDTGATDSFDRFSAIIVRGQRCPLSSVTKSAAPPKKAKKKS